MHRIVSKLMARGTVYNEPYSIISRLSDRLLRATGNLIKSGNSYYGNYYKNVHNSCLNFNFMLISSNRGGFRSVA